MENRIQAPNVTNPILVLKRSDNTLQAYIEKWKRSVVYLKLAATANENLFNPGATNKFGADFGQRDYLVEGLAHLGTTSKELIKLSDGEQDALFRRVLRQEFNLDENEQALRTALNLEATDDLLKILIEGHSQLPSYFVPKYLFEEAIYTRPLQEDEIDAEPNSDAYAEKSAALIEVKTQTYQIRQPINSVQNLVRRDDGVYLELFMEDFPIDTMSGNSAGIFTGQVKMVFKLTKQGNEWGYQLIELQTNSADLVKMLDGQGLTDDEIQQKYCQPQHTFKATILALETAFDTKLKNLATDDLDSGMVGHSPHYTLIDHHLREIVRLVKEENVENDPDYAARIVLLRNLKKISNHPLAAYDSITELEAAKNRFTPNINQAIQSYIDQLEEIAKLQISQKIFKSKETFKHLNAYGRTLLDADFKAELARVSAADRINILSLVSSFIDDPLNGNLIRALARATLKVQQEHAGTQLSLELLRTVKGAFDTARMTLGGENYDRFLKGATEDCTLSGVRSEVVELITKAKTIVESSNDPMLIVKISIALNAVSNLIKPRNQANFVTELDNIINELDTDDREAVESIMPHLKAIQGQAEAIQVDYGVRTLLTESMGEVNLRKTTWAAKVDNEVQTLITSADANPSKKEKSALSNEADRQSEINDQIKKLVTNLEKQIQKAILDKKDELSLADVTALKSFMLRIQNYLKDPKECANAIAEGYDLYIKNSNFPPKLKKTAQHLGELTEFAQARKHLIATINTPANKDSSIAMASRELLTDIDIRTSDISKRNDRMRLMSDALNETAEIVKNNNRDLTKYRKIANEISNIPGWKKALGIVVGITGLALIGASVVVACASMGVLSLPSIGGMALGVSMIGFGVSVGLGATVAAGTGFSLWRMWRKPVKGDMENVMKQLPPRNAV